MISGKGVLPEKLYIAIFRHICAFFAYKGKKMFSCCGVKYKKSDIETYWCIETYAVKPVTKKFVDKKRVFTESVETCICKKCGLQLLQIKRFGRENSRKKLLGVEEMKGEQADLFLVENQEKLKIQPQICPTPLIACATTLPAVYGAVISPTKQRAKYDASLPQKESWRNKFENGKWKPDIFHSECKVVND